MKVDLEDEQNKFKSSWNLNKKQKLETKTITYLFEIYEHYIFMGYNFFNLNVIFKIR